MDLQINIDRVPDANLSQKHWVREKSVQVIGEGRDLTISGLNTVREPENKDKQ
jgi:hypothetical protein